MYISLFKLINYLSIIYTLFTLIYTNIRKKLRASGRMWAKKGKATQIKNENNFTFFIDSVC